MHRLDPLRCRARRPWELHGRAELGPITADPANAALKHRADGETRRVPIHPEQVTMLREHLEEFGTGPHGRLFTGPRGAIITDRAYLKVFNEARGQALSAQEASCSAAEVRRQAGRR